MSSIDTAISSPQADVIGHLDQRSIPSRRYWSRQIAVDIVAVLDIVIVLASGLLPAILFSATAGIECEWYRVLKASALAAVIVALAFASWGAYTTDSVNDLRVKPLQTLAALLIAILAVSGLGNPSTLTESEVAAWNLVWGAPAYTLLLAHHMTAKHLLARWTAQGRFNERIAVFGAGAIARHVRDHLASAPLGIHFVGVFDDRSTPGRVNDEGLHVQGGLASLLQIAADGAVDRVIIALPPAAERRIASLTKPFEAMNTTVFVVSHVASEPFSQHGEMRGAQLGPVGLIEVQRRPLRDWDAVVKRGEDIVIGAVLLVATLPLWAIIALAIKLETPGPVLFRQRRRGLNQRVFEVLKFRTMTVLEDGNDVRQVAEHDPRVTRVGRILRASSADELPQLINVLKGEMSLVGPRPHALVHDDQFGAIVSDYPIRTQVKPGITGLAQVSGLRGETATPEKIRARVAHDLDYIRNWSPALDLKIMMRTVWTILHGKNAH